MAMDPLGKDPMSLSNFGAENNVADDVRAATMRRPMSLGHKGPVKLRDLCGGSSEEEDPKTPGYYIMW
eukprot:4556257-Alexandrium_andersonii.AAC.1